MDGDKFEEYDTNDDSFKALHQIFSLNSDAVFLDQNKVINDRTVKGDASEAALIKFS